MTGTKALWKTARTGLLLLIVAAVRTPAHAGDLKPETLVAFKRYVTLTEKRIARQLSDPQAFLYINTLSAEDRDRALATLRQGDVYMVRLTTRDPSGQEIAVPDGMIHHWLATVFIPQASLNDVVKVVQDYDHKQDIYPEVVKSHLISRDGEHFRAMMRFREHHVITVTLDTEHDIVYTPVDSSHWYSRSYSTRVSQVEGAGTPEEHDLPDGEGAGFMWRIDSYWRFVQQDGGTFVEVEAISLTRAIPTGVGWIVKPFVASVPRESLHDTLSCTRSAVLRRRVPSEPPMSGSRR